MQLPHWARCLETRQQRRPTAEHREVTGKETEGKTLLPEAAQGLVLSPKPKHPRGIESLQDTGPVQPSTPRLSLSEPGGRSSSDAHT